MDKVLVFTFLFFYIKILVEDSGKREKEEKIKICCAEI